MFRLRRGRPTWAVPVLLFLAVLLVAALAFNLANLETGGEGVPVAPNLGDSPPAAGFEIDPALFYVLFVSVSGLFLAAMIFVILRYRVQRKASWKPSSWWEALASVLGLAMFLLVLLIWPRMVHAFQSTNETAATGPTDPSAGVVTDWPAAVGSPFGLFLVLIAFAMILIVSSLLRRGAGSVTFRTAEAVPKPADRRAAAAATQDAIQELELGGDVRTAILGCFQRFCAVLGARGISDQDALTPRELEGLAVERLGVSHGISETLTSLFEEARYSEHPLGEADRARAIDSLTRIRAALGA